MSDSQWEWGTDNMFKDIKGKTLRGVTRASDGVTLTFHAVDGDYIYDARGDCCSESWVESISDNVYAVTDATVQDILMKTLENQPGTRQDVDEVDFVTLVTDKGHFDIEFRNSSNGYYGGWMDLVSCPVTRQGLAYFTACGYGRK